MYPEYTQLLPQAVSLAWFYQDPLVKTLGLWSDPNEDNILSLKLHDLQNEFNEQLLLSRLEATAFRQCSHKGIDFNQKF